MHGATGPINMSPNYVTNAPDYIMPPSAVTYYFSPRFGLRWDNAWDSDVAVNWSKKIAQSRTDLFFRGVVTNLFNNSALISGDSTILTKASPGSALGLRSFNPFTETPVRGVNWTYWSWVRKPNRSRQLPDAAHVQLLCRFEILSNEDAFTTI